MKLTQTLKAAIARGKFESKELTDAMEKLLKVHDDDLEFVGYTMSTEIERAVKDLDAVMNDLDEEKQRRTELVKEAAAEGRELEE